VAHEGLAIRLLTRPTELPPAAYSRRLAHELEVIQASGLALKAHYPREFADALKCIRAEARDYLAWPA
jgi:hypothetical protein